MSSISKRVLITGISGQDGSWLAELLLSKGYQVYGIVRRSSSISRTRIDHIKDKICLYYGDITDPVCIDRILRDIQPQEIYHLAAQSHVQISFDTPEYTAQVDGLGTLYILESMKKWCRNARFYNACTSELFGKVQEVPQKETTPFYPRSPYGIAKLFSYWTAKNYREQYGMFICNGILFNHESERRGENFVTKKIVNGLTNYFKTGKSFQLGNLDAKRDWGYAKEYVESMWLMLQQEEADDFVIATGETHTIKEFIDECLKHLPIKAVWNKTHNVLQDLHNNNIIILIDKQHFRPTEVDILVGDYSKAKEKLGWEPKVKFSELAKIMMLDNLK